MPPSAASRRILAWAAAGLLLATALAVTAAIVVRVVAGRADREALELLAAADPEARRVAAWRTTQHSRTPRALREIARRLESGEESVPAVREAYAHAVGRSDDPEVFPILAAIVRNDPDAYVRHTAWIAAARLAPDRFRRLAAETPERESAWDELGVACAWLELGDLRGVDDLLEWAADGDPAQKRVASLALLRGVAPLLDAAGRWPREYTVREGETWPAALVDEVRARLVGLDVQAVADEIAPSVERAAEVRRVVRRVTSTRDRLARVLLGSSR